MMKAFGAYCASMTLYAAVICVPGLLFTALNAPVGGGKVGVVAIIYFPGALLTLGWAQGKQLFKMHMAAIALIGFEAWRFQAFYDPQYYVGTLQKEWPYHVSMVSLLVYGLCALATAIRNAWLVWKGRAIEMRIPLYGQISIGRTI